MARMMFDKTFAIPLTDKYEKKEGQFYPKHCRKDECLVLRFAYDKNKKEFYIRDLFLKDFKTRENFRFNLFMVDNSCIEQANKKRVKEINHG
jgi:hypothetical protein